MDLSIFNRSTAVNFVDVINVESTIKMFKEFEYPNPVHEKDGKWYFSDEHWSDVYGPYETQKIANEQCYLYALNLDRELTDEEKARIVVPFYKCREGP